MVVTLQRSSRCGGELCCSCRDSERRQSEQLVCLSLKLLSDLVPVLAGGLPAAPTLPSSSAGVGAVRAGNAVTLSGPALCLSGLLCSSQWEELCASQNRPSVDVWLTADWIIMLVLWTSVSLPQGPLEQWPPGETCTALNY